MTMQKEIDSIFVREATLEDFDECCRLAIEATKENSLVKPNYEKLLQHIYSALTRDHGIMGVIGPSGGKLEGAILLRIGELWYSSELIIEEKAIFVDHEFRSAKGGRARKLAEWGKHVSNELGIPLTIGVLSNDRTEGKMRLYERMFGKPAGVYFIYNGNTGEGDE